MHSMLDEKDPLRKMHELEGKGVGEITLASTNFLNRSENFGAGLNCVL